MKQGEKLRILHLIPTLLKGGAERFAIDICKGLNEHPDVEVILAVMYNENAYKSIIQDLPIVFINNYINLSISGKTVIKSDDYIKLIDDFKPQVIHTNLFRAELFSAVYIKDNISYVTHGHDNMIQLEKFSLKMLFKKERITNFYERNYLFKKKYTKIKTSFIANSEDTSNYFHCVLPERMRKEILTIPYGFNFDRFFYKTKKQLTQTEKIRIVNIGSFIEEKKNQEFLIDIAKELIKLNINFEINVLGEGPRRKQIQELVKRNELNDKILFHGNVDNVENWLWESDIYLHTAWYEPFGLVFLEAMAAGLPCVALDGKGNRGLIKDDYNGYFIYEQKALLFADKINSLINNKELYELMSENGKQFAEKFDLKSITQKYVDFYKSILK